MRDTILKTDPRGLASAVDLKVFAGNGDLICNVSSSAFKIYEARIDTTIDLLYFKTHQPYNGTAITGIEIHDLKADSMLYKIVCDTALFIKLPQLYEINEFMAFSVFDIHQVLKEIYLFDRHSKKMFKKEIAKKYQSYHSKTSGPYVILYFEPGEDDTVYDTLLIKDFEPFR